MAERLGNTVCCCPRTFELLDLNTKLPEIDDVVELLDLNAKLPPFNTTENYEDQHNYKLPDNDIRHTDMPVGNQQQHQD